MAKRNELTLTLDTATLYNDLIKYLLDTVLNLAEQLANEMKARTKSHRVIDSIKFDLVSTGFETIRVAVGSDHWWAFIDNYGSGSKMMDSTPYLAEYKDSEFWNPDRPNKNVVGRRMGIEYNAPDYDEGHGLQDPKPTGSGNFWDFKNDKPKPLEPEAFKARPASLFLETSFLIFKKRFEDGITKAINDFPFHKYLKGGV